MSLSEKLLKKLPSMLSSYVKPFYMGRYTDRKAGYKHGYLAAVRELEKLEKQTGK